MRLIHALPLLLLAAPAVAQTEPVPPTNATEAADRFNLDLPPVDPDTAVTASPAADPAVHRFTIDTPIAQLIDDRRAKAVLDRNLPGLSKDKNLPKFRLLTLRKLQPASGGRLTDELLARTGEDLAAID